MIAHRRPAPREHRALRRLVLAGLAALACADSPTGGDGAPAFHWRDLGVVSGATSGSAVVVVDGAVLVGANDGVYRRPLDGSAAWQRVGAERLAVRVLRSLPGTPATVLAGGDPMEQPDVPTLYRADDGGHTWAPSAEGLHSATDGRYVPVSDLAVQPVAQGSGGGPVLYANTSATTIARSRDGGRTWQHVVGETALYANPDCYVHVAAAAPAVLLQGCESPLDHAWVGTYDISDPAAATLGPARLAVGAAYEIQNRRPNSFASSAADPGAVLVGLEGAVIELRGDAWRWIWRAATGSGGEPYTYVNFIWTDPADPQHLVFAGGDAAGDPRAGAHETHDRGGRVTPLEGPGGQSFDGVAVLSGAPYGPAGEHFALLTQGPAGLRVLAYERADAR